MDTQMLYKWLKCGFVDTKQLFPTEEGTPQGGTISPVLMNMTLDGLERTLKERFPTREYRNRKTHFTKVNFVRYADDFIITGESPELLQNEVLPLVRQFMAERGLQLSEEKTVITHIDEGFDFLGQNIRKYNGKLLIKPSKSSAKSFLKKIREIVKSNKGAPQDLLIRKLNPVIRGWVNYHRYVVSAETFSWIDYQIYKCLWQWATRRHRHKGRKWIAKKYWHYIGTRQWTFAAELKGDSTKAPYLALEYATNTNILRFKKIVAEANPFDERWNGYYEERDGEKILGRAGEHQRHPCGGGTFPAGNGRRAERGGRCPLRKFCRGRCVRPQRHDHPQRNLRSRSYRLGQQRMQLLAEQSCPLCQHHQRQLYEHGCGLLVLLHRRGAVYLLDCYLQLKLLLVFIHKL